MSVLYVGEPERGRKWAAIFRDRAPDLPIRVWPDIDDPKAIRYLVAWKLPPALVGELPNLEAVFSVGAGVDQLDLSAIPERLPLARMIEPSIVAGVVTYVTMAVLALHRNLIDYIAQQREGRWQAQPMVLPAARRVGLMGRGLLGKQVLASLARFGFPLASWARTPASLDGIDCFAGPEDLALFLARSDILICLVPLTPATRGILDARTFAALPRGAGLVNAGRGGHLVEADLLPALDSGQLSAAILDVFEPEPLPAGHAFWRHPRILVTPHVGATTQAETAAEVLLANIRRHQRGETLQGLIDRSRGY
ncbi:MAG TPA: glyoxylate/hydroxypyruvate reductase A [Stellaceae bacterium]|nr:glyoxylate/hydroxypyruvate reductase A [Stellaceae bacterium]